MNTSRLAILSAALLTLAACTPAAQKPVSPEADSTSSWPANDVEVVNLQLENTVSTDAQGTVTSDATLTLDGKKIPLGTIPGELKPVARQEGQDPSVIATLTSWWAGAGDEIRVTRSADAKSLLVEHRSGDESGTCTAWEKLTAVDVSPDTEVQLVAESGSELPRSSLAFCDAPSSSR